MLSGAVPSMIHLSRIFFNSPNAYSSFACPLQLHTPTLVFQAHLQFPMPNFSEIFGISLLLLLLPISFIFGAQLAKSRAPSDNPKDFDGVRGLFLSILNSQEQSPRKRKVILKKLYRIDDTIHRGVKKKGCIICKNNMLYALTRKQTEVMLLVCTK